MNETHPVVLLGAGGHAKVLLDVIRLRGHSILGVCAPELQPGTQWEGIEVLGNDAVLKALDPDQICLVNGVGLVPRSTARRRVQETFSEKGYQWLTLEHPSSLRAAGGIIEDGVQLMASVTVQPGYRFGAGVIVNTGAVVDHDCQLGEHVFVGPGAVLCGGVKTGRGVFIGAGAVILPQVEIGDDTIIGAGAIVTRSVKAGCMAVGNPARIVK